MKNTSSSSIFFIIVCLIVSSCGQHISNFSSVKRQYRNGYYLSNHHNKSADSKAEGVIASTINDNVIDVSLNNKKEEGKEIVLEDKINTIGQESITLPAGVIANNKSGDSEKASASVSHKKTPVSIFLKKSNSIKKAVSQSDDKHNRRGPIGSLIWTIIVILFILWLLGFLIGGFGGLIYLLLVAALVLLILKITGII